MMNKKHVFIICGAAGSGKTMVANYLREHYGMHQVITHTTRKPRPGECDGVDYHFEDEASMARLHLLEKVTYDGAQYGSSYEGLKEGKGLRDRLGYGGSADLSSETRGPGGDHLPDGFPVDGAR